MAQSTTAQILPIGQTGSRRLRSPKHNFLIEAKPFQIAPFLIAPVLPGETLKNARIQARVVTDPIKNKLIGWWKEYYFFYVKHRDLADSAMWQSMMLDLETDLSTKRYAANSASYYGYEGAVVWQTQCYNAIVQHYFRDQDESILSGPGAAAIGNYYAAKVNYEGIGESLTLDTVVAGEFDGPEIPEDADNASIGDLARLQQQYAFMSQMGYMKMTYEDYLRSNGVSIPKREEINKPELLRYVRDWSYPSNTVDPTDGSVASAVSWSVAERLDKDRFFKEPGFIFGVTTTRPKVYLSGQFGAASGALDNALLWLPSIMRDDPSTSLKQFAEATSNDGLYQSITSGTGGYWVDVRDLLVYGDQFTNVDLASTVSNMMALPDANGNKKYPTEAMVDALFAADTAEMVREDGVVSLEILGHQMDMT